MSKGPSSSPESLETTGVGVDLQRLVLDSDHYDAFMHVLDNPPAPGPKLRSLMRRVSTWRK
jgi:uncharacterized protein (DUF1778 family)